MTRRVFVAALPASIARQQTSRNDLWRKFVPLVKDCSARLIALQDYMLAHQNEPTLLTLDRGVLSNLDCCIDDVQEMVQQLKTLRDLIKNGA